MAPDQSHMNDVLRDPVRHNNWATRRLLAHCREARLSNGQLSDRGSSWGILTTLRHIVEADADYLRALAGSAPPREGGGAGLGLEGLEGWALELEQGWERLLSAPIDVERVIIVDDGAYEVRAGIFLAQALNHANHHRQQVCALLRSLGIEPPDVQAWEYAWATKRLWRRGDPG